MSTEQTLAILAVVQDLFPELVSEISIQTFVHPKIDEKYGEINLTTIPLNNSEGMPLLVIPGYSFKSFKTMLGKIRDGFSTLRTSTALFT